VPSRSSTTPDRQVPPARLLSLKPDPCCWTLSLTLMLIGHLLLNRCQRPCRFGTASPEADAARAKIFNNPDARCRPPVCFHKT
jgi:hypothetical protein